MRRDAFDYPVFFAHGRDSEVRNASDVATLNSQVHDLLFALMGRGGCCQYIQGVPYVLDSLGEVEAAYQAYLNAPELSRIALQTLVSRARARGIM